MDKLALSPEQQNDIYIASGGSHLGLARDTADFMGVTLGGVARKRFPNTERYVRYESSVRGQHVFIIQTLAATPGSSVNDSLMELMLMIDAAKRSSAAEITAIVPYLAYSRQDRKARGREPISAAMVVNMLQHAGADRLVSIDMHSAQTQATFRGPFDHLTAEPLIQAALRQRIGTNYKDFVMVSPDGGRAAVAEDYAEALGIDVLHAPKSRSRQDSSKISRPAKITGIKGRTALLVDDMIDTAGTLVSAAKTLKDSGAPRIIVCATHAIFSSPALKRLSDAPIDEIIVTDTIPLDKARKVLGKKLDVISAAPLIGRALSEIATGGSISHMFDDRNYR